MVSALHSGRPNQRFQNREEPAISKAFRLPNRAQNKTRTQGKTQAVGMRGSGLRSEIPARISADNPKTFSE